MQNDIYVSERTEEEITRIALAVRGMLEFDNQCCPDLIFAVENYLPKVIPQFALIPVRDDYLGEGRRAVTKFHPPRIEITNTGYKELRGNGLESRFDIVHELGHLFLHHDGSASLYKYRSAGNVIHVRRASMSGERQADIFGREVLLPQHIVRFHDTVDEIVQFCRVPVRFAQEAFTKYGATRPIVVPDELRSIINRMRPSEPPK